MAMVVSSQQIGKTSNSSMNNIKVNSQMMKAASSTTFLFCAQVAHSPHAVRCKNVRNMDPGADSLQVLRIWPNWSSLSGREAEMRPRGVLAFGEDHARLSLSH